MTRRSQKEADLRDELQFHLEQEAAEALAAGVAGDQAKWAARRELGNIALLMEEERKPTCGTNCSFTWNRKPPKRWLPGWRGIRRNGRHGASSATSPY